jgi:hypothetical protein
VNGSPLVAAVTRELAKFPNLDRRAILAIASQEGLGGGIGDQGTSFGPFQLHQGGALPSGIPLSSAQQWAWSPAGLDYALSNIARVAGGLRGAPAIEAISTRFERPANPAAEIAGAERAYGLPVTGGAAIQYAGAGGGSPAGMPSAAPAGPSSAAPDTRALFARALLAAIGPTGQLNTGGLIRAIQARG